MFKSLRELLEARFPHEPKPFPSRVEYWSKIIERTGLEKTRWIWDYNIEVRLPCIPAFKRLRSQYPKEVLRKADMWFHTWWEGEDINLAREALLGKGKLSFRMDPLLHSYLCDLQSLTQAVYRKLFPQGRVVLYRGVSGEYAIESLLRLVRTRGEINLYPLSSFSESIVAAKRFANSTGYIIRQEVPLSRIKYSWRVVGSGQEKEVMVNAYPFSLKNVRVPKRVQVAWIEGSLEVWKTLKSRTPRNLANVYQLFRKTPRTIVELFFSGRCKIVHFNKRNYMVVLFVFA